MEAKGFAVTIILAVTISLMFGATITYVVMQRQKEQITLNITIIPQDLYPLNLEDWTFKLQFGNSETYTAQKGSTQLQADTLYNLLKQIHGTS